MLNILQRHEIQYCDILTYCHDHGQPIRGRNGLTRQVVGQQIRIDASKGLPILWGRKIFPKNFLHELKWFLNGDTNIAYLNDNGVTIWDKWADEFGNLGPTYGYQLRHFGEHNVDQVALLLKGLKRDLFGRRHIITLWEPFENEVSSLPPCYFAMQFLVDDKVNLIVTQRSCDLFVGLPYDMCLLYCLLELVTHEINEIHGTKYTTGILTINFGSAHYYVEHYTQIMKYYEQTKTLEYTHKIIVDGLETGIDRFNPNTCEIIGGYSPREHIKTEVVK